MMQLAAKTRVSVATWNIAAINNNVSGNKMNNTFFGRFVHRVCLTLVPLSQK